MCHVCAGHCAKCRDTGTSWEVAVTAAMVTAGRMKNLALSVHPGDPVTRSGLFQLSETADMYLGPEAPAPARLQQRASPSQE